MIKYFELPLSKIGRLEPLWTELNEIHKKDSKYFKPHFINMTFKKRVESLKLYNCTNIKIFVCSEKSILIGYAIAGIENQTGEIESLIVKSEFNGNGIGKKLVMHCNDWFNDQKCNRIKVGVAFGHENVYEFYMKLGFFPKMTFFELVNKE